MKTMTCNQLGGACDLEFAAESFDEIASLSQQHGKEMFAVNDPAHLEAMSSMMQIMSSGGMDDWMSARRAEFEAL